MRFTDGRLHAVCKEKCFSLDHDGMIQLTVRAQNIEDLIHNLDLLKKQIIEGYSYGTLLEGWRLEGPDE